MPKTHEPGDLPTDRPTRQPPAPQSRALSRRTRGVESRPDLASTVDEHAGRRSRVEGALAAGRLTIRSRRDGETHTVEVLGELDVATVQSVDDKLRAAEAAGARQVVLDLAGLTFMDSSGVHLVARADARRGAAAERLALLRGPPRVQRVFALAEAGAPPFAA